MRPVLSRSFSKLSRVINLVTWLWPFMVKLDLLSKYCADAKISHQYRRTEWFVQKKYIWGELSDLKCLTYKYKLEFYLHFYITRLWENSDEQNWDKQNKTKIKGKVDVTYKDKNAHSEVWKPVEMLTIWFLFQLQKGAARGAPSFWTLADQYTRFLNIVLSHHLIDNNQLYQPPCWNC